MCVYERNTDEENIRLIREENDNAAFEYLIKKYMGIVKKESRALYIIGAENEDIIQEGMIGLIKAIRSFDGSKGASFSTFANLCIKRQLITAVKLSNRKKHSPLNYYVSFYTENDDDVALVDELQADQAFEPENQMLGQLESQKLAEAIDKKLSKADLRRLAGFSSNTLTKLRRDEIVALPILDKICDLLDADYGDIMEHVKTTKEQE